MKSIILLAIIFGTISCNFKNDKVQEIILDNQELTEMFKSDQADRTQNIDRNIIQKNDSLREARVYELLDSNKVRTSADYNNAALIFQHGEDSVAYGMAVKLMKKSIELDPTRDKWLLAAAIDRDLLSRNRPQIYGTQYTRPAGQPFERMEMDTTIISDSERIEFGVETLAEQREKILNLNRRKLTELLDEGKTIDEIVDFARNEDRKVSQYDLRETWFNHFGYNLMREGKKEDALKILKLNTELFPDSYNTFDSYGECLLQNLDTVNAVIAYRKSLELNPDQENAKKILSNIIE